MTALQDPPQTAAEVPTQPPQGGPGKNPVPKGGLKPFQYRDEKGVIRTLPKPSAKPPPPELSSETHPLAEVIEWVIAHPPEDDRTHEQKFYRSIKDESPAAFAKMRASFKESAPAESEPDATAECPFPELEEAWSQFQAWSRTR